MEGPTFLEVLNGSDVSREMASKLHSSGTTVMENEVEMVRRSAEELEDDRGIAICVSNRTFGFLTENEIMQLFELPRDCLIHRSSQVQYSFKSFRRYKSICTDKVIGM